MSGTFPHSSTGAVGPIGGSYGLLYADGVVLSPAGGAASSDAASGGRSSTTLTMTSVGPFPRSSVVMAATDSLPKTVIVRTRPTRPTPTERKPRDMRERKPRGQPGDMRIQIQMPVLQLHGKERP
jgi:hypothetical protein